MSNEPFVISDSDEELNAEEVAYIRELGNKYRDRAPTPLRIPPLQTVFPEDYERMEGDRTRPEVASTSGAAERPESPRIEPTEADSSRDLAEVVPSEGGEGEEANPRDTPRAHRAEASTLSYGDDWEEVPLPKGGEEECPYVKEFDPDFPERLVQFRARYGIPEDVEVELLFGDRIDYGDDHVTVPLMAITEGGLRFPFPKMVRQLLHYYDLGPHQVVVNVYRVLFSILKLAEQHHIPATIYDVLGIYLVALSPRFRRYYFSVRNEYHHLITDLYDKEEHQYNYVVVRGNYTWAPEEPHTWPLNHRRGDPSKPNATLSFKSCIFLYFASIVSLPRTD
jgi:hypothetical protein